MKQLDMDNERKNFAIQASLIHMDLERMIEKTNWMLKMLSVDPIVSTTDFYHPEDDDSSPPKKKMRM